MNNSSIHPTPLTWDEVGSQRLAREPQDSAISHQTPGASAKPQAVPPSAQRPATRPSATQGQEKPPSSFSPDLVCLGDVEARAVQWLWEPFVPSSMVSMLSGDPGAGKSFVALALAADLTRGRLRDGRNVEPASVIYLSVENPIAESVRPRFDLLGGDPARFYMLRGKSFDGGHSGVSLADIDVLRQSIQEKKAKLLVVDPIQSYLGAGVDLHRSNETRPVMDGLGKLAEETGCAILLLRHLSKAGGSKAISRGLGSIDLTGAVRSELLAGSLPDDPSARALVHIKSNVGRLGRAQGFAIDDQGTFSWTGVSALTAGDLLAEPTRPGDKKILQASEWLRAELADGAKEQAAIREKAESEGFSLGTLRRAKAKLRVHSVRSGFGGSGTWMWALPDSTEPPEGEEAPKVLNTCSHENLSTYGQMDSSIEAQNRERERAKSFVYQTCSKSLCEHLNEHLCNEPNSLTAPLPSAEEDSGYSKVVDKSLSSNASLPLSVSGSGPSPSNDFTYVPEDSEGYPEVSEPGCLDVVS
jgi:hypothetical protein